ncbi:Hypothetical predicted protein [Lecanosticta acicola]|uniref:Uncharacterized protein n=1 Tax=Lecanosticta acicola TaxID=111012 RepID=A0AAI9EEC7_9PEZI|nr:Hypothetical predicted protein [Lecanosticta acicola]
MKDKKELRSLLRTWQPALRHPDHKDLGISSLVSQGLAARTLVTQRRLAKIDPDERKTRWKKVPLGQVSIQFRALDFEPTKRPARVTVVRISTRFFIPGTWKPGKGS